MHVHVLAAALNPLYISCHDKDAMYMYMYMYGLTLRVTPDSKFHL